MGGVEAPRRERANVLPGVNELGDPHSNYALIHCSATGPSFNFSLCLHDLPRNSEFRERYGWDLAKPHCAAGDVYIPFPDSKNVAGQRGPGSLMPHLHPLTHGLGTGSDAG